MSKNNQLDSEIVKLWKEHSPSSAYTMGFNDMAGDFFIPSDENISKILKQANILKEKAADELQLKVLDSMIQELNFDEPQVLLEQILGSIFNHMVKEGIVDSHMKSLLQKCLSSLNLAKKKYSKRDVPIGVKVLTLYRLEGILGILEVVSSSTKDQMLKSLCSEVGLEAKDFVRTFDIEGFGRGEFERVTSIFERYGFELGRKDIYREMLKKGFDYSEEPEQLEEKALRWLDEELREISKIIPIIARELDCSEDYEDISKAIQRVFYVSPEDLVKVTNEIRGVTIKYVNEYIARVNPKYDTRVIETPDYLTGTIPSAAASFFDTFTDNPFQLYFVTTDKSRDPMKSIPDLINTLVHEEYGHCLHHSNSSTNFIAEPRDIEKISTLLEGPITEGLSFNREFEFLESLRDLMNKEVHTQAETEMKKLADRYGGLKKLVDAYEFETRRWRLIRFLRVIGDVRVNTGKQGILQFIDWAEKKTRLNRSSIYYQLFPAHEYIPGYATCYAVVGQEIRSLELGLSKDKRLDFQTYLCSIASPPRSIYISRLRSFSERLKSTSS